MHVEAVHQLAVALSSSPRLFACLLGSGVSRSAGIPTGWQVVLELVRKRAALLGEPAAAEKDPEAWHLARFGRPPDYSELVTALAPTTDLRRNLLEPYFTVHDAVSGQRHEHRPTDAHRAIAKLVRRGLVRVVITTNFDRLMEQALREAGVARVEVVSSEAAAADCYPFHASEAFVLKLHGDWRDVWLRNSRAELAEYPPALAQLLQRIVDEHGLVVSGWSAEYDVALREAVARRRRRFPIFWSDPRPGESTRALVERLGATHVALGADDFFRELDLANAAWERQGAPPPLADDVLVARAKRFIAEKREMDLEDLVQDATRALCAWIEELDLDDDRAKSDAAARERALEILAACEAHARALASLIATLARYRQSHEPVQHSLSALLASARARYAPETTRRWWWLAAYPALLCAYVHGVAAGFRDDWRAVIVAMRDAGSGHADGEVRLPPWSQAYYSSPAYAGVPGVDPAQRFVERIADWAHDVVRDWIPRREAFDRIFDRVDLLLCVLSLRTGSSEWKPRCAIAAANGFAPERSFDALVERWLIETVERSTMNGAGDALEQVFAGIDDDRVYERIRSWSPAPST